MANAQQIVTAALSPDELAFVLACVNLYTAVISGVPETQRKFASSMARCTAEILGKGIVPLQLRLAEGLRATLDERVNAAGRPT